MVDAVGIVFIGEVPTDVTNALSSVQERVDNQTGAVIVTTGYLRNLRVNVNDQKLTLDGSLPKFMRGNNLDTLSRSEIREVLQHISEDLKVDMLRGHAYRFEAGVTIKVEKPVETYCQQLGESSRYSRTTMRMGHGCGVYYDNSLRTLVFYDKVREMKEKHERIPENYLGNHLLRYELRFRQRLPKQFNVPEVTASMLREETFFRGIVERWQSEYTRISKLRRFVPRVIPADVRSMKNALALKGIQSCGGEAPLLETLSAWRKAGSVKMHQYSRLRAMVKTLTSSRTLTYDDVSIIELDAKIRQAAEELLA